VNWEGIAHCARQRRGETNKAIVDFYACGTKTAKLAFRNSTLARQHRGTPATGHSPILAFLPDQ
jgi:hypothetical protein